MAVGGNAHNCAYLVNFKCASTGYWAKHKKEAFEQLCADEKIKPEQLEKLMQNYQFANRLPHQHEIVSALGFKPLIKERKSILERVGDKIQTFINTFIEGMGGSV